MGLRQMEPWMGKALLMRKPDGEPPILQVGCSFKRRLLPDAPASASPRSPCTNANWFLLARVINEPIRAGHEEEGSYY